jgi:hypothetical protein
MTTMVRSAFNEAMDFSPGHQIETASYSDMIPHFIVIGNGFDCGVVRPLSPSGQGCAWAFSRFEIAAGSQRSSAIRQ